MIHAAEIAASPVAWIGDPPADPSAPEARVLFTRVILRRNFAGFPFWASATPDACERLWERAREHAAARGFDAGLRLADLPRDAIGLLRERLRLPEIPSSFPGKRDFKRLFLSSDAAEHALFGEAEHWVRIRSLKGLPMPQESPRVLAFDGEEDPEGTVFSRSPFWGHLTSDPVFTGAGVQLDAGLHLPALAATRRVGQAQQAMAAMGFELRPLSLRDPGFAEAGFFRLLSRGGGELTPEELLARFAGKARALLGAETAAWDGWLAREAHAIEDRAHRSLRILQEARRMDFPELLLLLSHARAGIHAGHFPSPLLRRLEELRVKAQPHHTRLHARAAADEPASRAAVARTLLKDY